MSVEIDSSEVLKHLRNYGISSVDDEALKLFIKDLKKLIKFESRKNFKNRNTESYESSPVQKHVSSVPTNRTSCSPGERHQRRLKTEIPNHHPIICCKCEPIHCCGGILHSDCHYGKSTLLTASENLSSRQKVEGPDKCCKCKLTEDKNSDCRKSPSKLQPKKDETTDQNPRPASLTSYSRAQSGGRTKKFTRDPVELYQYYQSIWKQHTLPGENDHAQLRRSIRDRLMKVK